VSTRLTPTSYVVLGLVDWLGPSTPYDLKRAVAAGLGNFWSFPHTQLYTEPERLAHAGLLRERREESGRRRKVYSLTAAGRRELEAWRGEPTAELTELRDIGLLKLYLGADPHAMAEVQLEAHRRKLHEYEELKKRDTGAEPRGAWQALDAGIGHAREWIRFWSGLAED
jgi:DNA-binding PadR family transcriptional regulator